MFTQIIDVHHHVTPKQYIKILEDRAGDNAVLKAVAETGKRYSIENDLEFMDKCGIRASVVSVSSIFDHLGGDASFASYLSRLGNEFGAGLIQSYPARYGAFASIPLPYMKEALQEMEYALDVLKLDGVLLASNYNGYYLGDSRFDELFSELNRRKAVAFVHPTVPAGLEMGKFGYPAPLVDFPHDTTRTATHMVLRGVLAKYPDVRIILAHAGGTVPYVIDKIAEAEGALYPPQSELNPGGVKQAFRRFYYDTALSAHDNILTCLTDLAETGHILIGTDYPYAIPGALEKTAAFKGFSKSDIARIGYENALTLFPRLA